MSAHLASERVGLILHIADSMGGKVVCWGDAEFVFQEELLLERLIVFPKLVNGCPA
jgi:hypothetical protein